ncbi:MAG TPA: hypothetical protein VER11_01590 [Polyangiaceae bacterium]|nr:hypothetical protein [Polyangiaceae bacterium]
MLRLRTSALALVLSVALGSCKRVEEPAQNEHPHAAMPSAASDSNSEGANSAGPAITPPQTPAHTPTQLLTLPSSAYQAALFADDEAIELLTHSAAYRLLPGQLPLTRQIDLGFAATVTRKNYVYWSQGALWSEPRRASTPSGATKLGALAEQPQRVVADLAADEFAFLTRPEGNQQIIAKLENKRVKALYASTGPIDALTMLGDTLYFVERPSAGGWRIGGVKFAGGEPFFTSGKSGRWPALLSGKKDLVYYDGARRNVLALSRDLQDERTLAKDFICSPMTAADNVYCSTMEGVFELSATGTPRQVVPASRKLITNLVANSQRLAFITDVGAQGQDQLAVYFVPLSAPSADEPPR